MKQNSRIRGFYKLNRGERIDALQNFTQLDYDQLQSLIKDGSLDFELSNLFIENSLGNYPLPYGIVTSFKVNQKDYILPMSVEESSVIAATSNAARIIYDNGGFTSKRLSNEMIGQIQILDIKAADFKELNDIISKHKEALIQKVNTEIHPRLHQRGGGAKDIEIFDFTYAEIPFAVIHLYLDCCDAMGANLINTACELLANDIEKLTQKRVGLKILSNLADKRVFQSQCRIDINSLDSKNGLSVAQKIVEAYVFAKHDPYRATTNNKGIMNGIDPIVIATGNDWRAIEAGAHAYAAREGKYSSLSKWWIEDNQYLCGQLEIPLQIGTVGGITRLHPISKLSLQILGNPNSSELSQLMACSGLAANFAALKALATSGIQKGHMKLHAKNIALSAGAHGKEVELIAQQLIQENKVSVGHAENLLRKLREQSPLHP